ncbi:Ger(x)C family spore germination protein [Neobacillus sp.]|uniref:Ger(x)C family spore germination protein n=1 Tax=Neobacillus sp. TaxID=2675273 RepID=UPI0035B50DB7
MKKKILTTLIIFLLTPVLSSCWDQNEMTNLAFIMGLGIDKGKNKKYDVSFQIILPRNVSSREGGNVSQGPPITVVKSPGDTLTEASRNVHKIVGRQLYYAHTNLVVVSDKVAKDKNLMLGIFDALTRDPDFRRTAQIVIAQKVTAEDILSALSITEQMPVNKITKQIQISEKVLGKDIKIDIDNFLDGIISEERESIATGYIVKGKKNLIGTPKSIENSKVSAIIMANGLAVFRQGKLVGWMDGDKSRGVNWVTNKLKNTELNLDWEGKKNVINFVPLRSRTSTSVRFKNKKPIFQVSIKTEGWVSEANAPIDLEDPNELTKIGGIAEEFIKNDILRTVHEAQKLKSDIFGFGEKVHRKNPKLWKELKGNWNEHFAESDVKVKVEVYVRQGGVRTNPFWVDLKK